MQVLIVGRGGGSSEDLWAFNDGGCSRHRCLRCPGRVGGWSRDRVTIADLVADARAATTRCRRARRAAQVDLVDVIRTDAVPSTSPCAAARRSSPPSSLRARLRDPRREVRAARARAVDIDLGCAADRAGPQRRARIVDGGRGRMWFASPDGDSRATRATRRCATA